MYFSWILDWVLMYKKNIHGDQGIDMILINYLCQINFEKIDYLLGFDLPYHVTQALHFKITFVHAPLEEKRKKEVGRVGSWFFFGDRKEK